MDEEWMENGWKIEGEWDREWTENRRRMDGE